MKIEQNIEQVNMFLFLIGFAFIFLSAMKQLHPAQKRLLDILRKTITDPLTIRELCERLHISSPSVVHHHILQLVKKGYLKRNPSNPNDYQILSDSPEAAIVYLNLYGLAQCGPNGSILDGNPIDKIPISSRLLSVTAADAFLVKARGDSMAPRINDKDLVIAKRSSHAADGAVVVCVNNEEALIKRICSHGKARFLTSINPKYEPIPVSSDFRIEGIVKGVISYGF
jgi:repressor LexA